MEYVVIYMPADRDWEGDLRGFESEEQAWEYIGEHFLCKTCKEELAAGGYSFEYDGKEEWHKITHPSSTGCGAEWEVSTWDEWIEFGGDPNIKRFDEKEA